MVILENIDIDKDILENMDIDNRAFLQILISLSILGISISISISISFRTFWVINFSSKFQILSCFYDEISILIVDISAFFEISTIYWHFIKY